MIFTLYIIIDHCGTVATRSTDSTIVCIQEHNTESTGGIHVRPHMGLDE